MAKRRNFTDEFRSKVALEALRDELTLPELACKYDVHLNQISTWKRKVIENMVDIFSSKKDKQKDNDEAEIKELHAKINQLSVENVRASGRNAIFYHRPSVALSGKVEGD